MAESSKIYDPSPLYDMPQICMLCYESEYTKNINCQIDYSRINGLVSLSTSEKKLNNLNQVKTIKTLNISNYTGINLIDLTSGEVLDSLNILHSSIRSLEGIQKFNRMQCLYLDYNRSLQDISYLSSLKKSLRALRIENCPKIQDFSVLEDLENLEFLVLLGKNELPDISFLSRLKKLKTFVFSMPILDGDLSLCLKLSYAFSCNNKNYYNYKNKELPKNQYYKGNENIELWRRLE